ncbi:putative non-specific serine/threonine protein kinase [Dioscorea sansibarensis]
MDGGHDTGCCFLLINAFIYLTLDSSIQSSVAACTISPGQSLSGNQTLASKGGSFELGFFSPGNSHKYYIGIWFKSIPSKDVIWVANRQAPMLNPSTSLLKLSKNSNLVLLNETRSPVWSSDYSSPSTSNSTVAVLLDTGNLVITKALNSTKHIISWRSSEDPSPGLYTAGYFRQVDLYCNDSWWYCSFDLPKGHGRYVSGTKTNLSFADFNQQIHLTNTTDLSVFTYILMEPSGLFRQMLWLNNSQQWISLYNQPEHHCALLGWVPTGISEGLGIGNWELGVWSSGCTRKTSSECDDNHLYGFFEMGMVELPLDSWKVDEVHSAEECEKTCRRDCFCTAYAYDERCSIWTGDLLNIKLLYDGDLSAGTLYIRLAVSDIPPPTSKSQTWFRSSRGRTLAEKHAEGFLISFMYADLQRMTKNFSNIMGRGGFGSVFKGALPDSIIIEMKKLEGFREKQFRAEVSMLCSIQHVNLVRLMLCLDEGFWRFCKVEF